MMLQWGVDKTWNMEHSGTSRNILEHRIIMTIMRKNEPSIKPGTWNISEHLGTSRNITEHSGTWNNYHNYEKNMLN